MKTEEIVAAMRCCADDVDCAGNCPLFGTGSPDEDCSQMKNRAAADRLEELVERCARYAEEIAVLRERMRPYEDTGLTADVCAEYRKFEDEVVASGKTFGRLLELLRADTDGACGGAAGRAGGDAG